MTGLGVGLLVGLSVTGFCVGFIVGLSVTGLGVGCFVGLLVVGLDVGELVSTATIGSLYKISTWAYPGLASPLASLTLITNSSPDPFQSEMACDSPSSSTASNDMAPFSILVTVT